MIQKDCILVAKCIRGLIKVPIGYKAEFVSALCKVLREEDYFFNEKKFRTIALDTLPKGWPNQVDGYYDKDEARKQRVSE